MAAKKKKSLKLYGLFYGISNDHLLYASKLLEREFLITSGEQLLVGVGGKLPDTVEVGMEGLNCQSRALFLRRRSKSAARGFMDRQGSRNTVTSSVTASSDVILWRSPSLYQSDSMSRIAASASFTWPLFECLPPIVAGFSRCAKSFICCAVILPLLTSFNINSYASLPSFFSTSLS